eukprot:s291_g6.t1
MSAAWIIFAVVAYFAWLRLHGDLWQCWNQVADEDSYMAQQEQRISALDTRFSALENSVEQQDSVLGEKVQENSDLLSMEHDYTMGLHYAVVEGVVRRCSRLHTLTVEVCDVPTLFVGRQNLSATDYDTSNYVAPKPEGEEQEELEEEELQARAAKAERLRKVFIENNYDSGDETAPAPGEVKAVSSALTKLLAELVRVVRSQVNLTTVECRGDAVPSHVKLDISRAAEEHQACRHGLAEPEERGAQTGMDVLQEQMAEIQSVLEGKVCRIFSVFTWFACQGLWPFDA